MTEADCTSALKGVPSAILFGLSASSEVVHSEPIEGYDLDSLRKVAEHRLSCFHAVEIWAESVRMVSVSRDPPSRN